MSRFRWNRLLLSAALVVSLIGGVGLVYSQTIEVPVSVEKWFNQHLLPGGRIDDSSPRTPPGIITREKAIAIAKDWAGPGLVSQARSINVRLAAIERQAPTPDPEDPDAVQPVAPGEQPGPQKRLAWIVMMDGAAMPSAGPPGVEKEVYPFRRTYVFVNANTGEVIHAVEMGKKLPPNTP